MATKRSSRDASRIRVRVQPRRPIDLQRLGRVVVELALTESKVKRKTEVDAESSARSAAGTDPRKAAS